MCNRGRDHFVVLLAGVHRRRTDSGRGFAARNATAAIVGAGDHIGAEIDTERVRQRIASREGMEALRNLDANPRRRGLLAALPTAA